MALSLIQDDLAAVSKHCVMKEDGNGGNNENNNRELGGFSFSSALIGPLGFHGSALTSSLFGSTPFLSWAPTPPASTEKREKVFVCRICNNSFGYKHVLQNHERTHTGEKPFECPQCHKRFTRDHHLKTHMRLHTGEKPYHCPHCDRHFVQVANLRRHLRVHTGERPYACQICSSKFSDSNQLKAHTLIHKGEKPFECSTCHVRFRRRHHLLHHKCPEDMLIEEDDVEKQVQKISNKKRSRERKPTEIRRIVRMPILIPEQTEPEDLSISKNNNNNQNCSEGLVPICKKPLSSMS